MKFDFNITGKNKEKILDFGCGGGGNLKYFSELGFKTYGVDITAANLKLSKKSMSHIDQPAIDLVSVGLEVIDPNELLGQILKDLADVLGQFNTSKFSSLKEEWMSYHVYQHQTVTLSLGDGRGVTGLAQGVTDDGALIIETPSAGIETFSSGEITLRKV